MTAKSDESRASHSSGIRFAGVMLWDDHLGANRELPWQFARQWADRNERVGLVRLLQEATEIHEFVREDATQVEIDPEEWRELLGADPAAGTKTPLTPPVHPDQPLLEILPDLSRRCDTLIIEIGPGMREQAVELVERCRHMVVLTTAESSHLVETYKTLKWLSPEAWEDMDISVFVCDAANESAARRIYDKLAKTAWEFLMVDLRWGGWAHPAGKIDNRLIGTLPTSPQVIRDLVNVLAPRRSRPAAPAGTQIAEPMAPAASAPPEAAEPARIESADEQAAALSTPPEAEHDVSAVAETATSRPDSTAAPSPDACTIPPAPTESAAPQITPPAVPTAAGPQRPPLHRTIPLNRLPADDAELTDILQLHLPVWLGDLPSVLILPVLAPPSIDRAVRIAVDAGGRLFLLVAGFTDGQILLGRALGARKWLIENLDLVLSSCPQIRIDRTLEPGLILVTTGEAVPLRAECSQIAAFPCRILACHFLQNGPEISLLVM